MQPQVVFGISVLLGFVVWGMIGARYIWPALRGRPRAEALRPVLLLHAFRFVGLAFLVPGVVSPDLPDAFAQPAAYGDLATSLLALLAIATLGSRLGTIIVWVFNIIGTVDLLNAFYQGDRLGVGIAPGLQGAAYFIPTVLVPLLLVTHALVFRILLGPMRGRGARVWRSEMSDQRVVLITGASSGVGQATARPLDVGRWTPRAVWIGDLIGEKQDPCRNDDEGRPPHACGDRQ